MARKKPGSGDNYPSLFDQIKDQRAELLKEVARIEAELKRIYGASYKEALELAAVRRAIEQGGDFSWDANAAASSQLTKVLNNLQSATNALLSNSVVASWAKGEENSEKNLYAALGGGKAGKEAIQATAEKARSAMRERGATAGGYLTKNEGGFSISERVWKLTEDAKKELQIIIQNGIKEGKTTDEIARSAQQYLKEPAKLFRRVRDKATGNLELSKAAKEYHPGQGVYRSSYKNALRLARTEITAAYRRAEWESYQSNPLIIGYEIRLSNNHTTTLPNGKTVKLTDICDRMAGRYPKTFLWTGWHPQCRCVMIPITVSKEDFKARIKALKKGELQEWKPKETVTEMPAGFNDWIKENAKRIQQAKARPYWITENYKGGDIKKGLVRQIADLKKIVEKQQEELKACHDFDDAIKELEGWAPSLGLDLSRAYLLREQGQRGALLEEINRIREQKGELQEKWLNATLDFKAFLMTLKKDGLTDLYDKYAAFIEKNRPDKSRNCAGCMVKLQQGLAAARIEYEVVKEARGAGKGEQVREHIEKEWFKDLPHELNKDFFKLIGDEIKLEVYPKRTPHGGCYYSPYKKTVFLEEGARKNASSYYREKIIYHEFGHGIADQRNLESSAQVKALMDKYRASLREKVVYSYPTREYYIDPATGRGAYKTVYVERKMMKIAAISKQIDVVAERIDNLPASVFERYGISKADVREAIGSTQDTIMSLNKSYGWGHTKSYFSSYHAAEAEFLAHAFENAFVGNAVFKHFLPDLYEEMIALIKGLK